MQYTCGKLYTVLLLVFDLQHSKVAIHHLVTAGSASEIVTAKK